MAPCERGGVFVILGRRGCGCRRSYVGRLGSQVSMIKRVDEMRTTHKDGTLVNNHVRSPCRCDAGRNLGRRKVYGCYRVTFADKPRGGTDNTGSGEEGDDEDKPISAQESTSGFPASTAVGREHFEGLLALSVLVHR